MPIYLDNKFNYSAEVKIAIGISLLGLNERNISRDGLFQQVFLAMEISSLFFRNKND